MDKGHSIYGKGKSKVEEFMVAGFTDEPKWNYFLDPPDDFYPTVKKYVILQKNWRNDSIKKSDLLLLTNDGHELPKNEKISVRYKFSTKK